MKKPTILALALVAGIFFPTSGHASYFTLPVDVNPTSVNNSWFDHNSSPGSFLRYDGNTTDNYDGHNGTDFATSTGADVVAPADGEVEEVYWDNCGGWQMHLWHNDIGLSTLYSHLGTTTSATTTDTVSRGEHIADVDTTGSCTTGPHLHFGVTDGANRATSNRIDPFGWSGGGSDPWTYDLGYLWKTSPPIFFKNWYEGFESFSIGTVNGQNSWVSTGLGNLDIVSSETNTGSRALSNSGGSADADVNIGFDLLDYGTTTMGLYYKSTDASITQQEKFLMIGRSPVATSTTSDGLYACALARETNNEIRIINGSSNSLVLASTSWSTNTYKNYEIEINPSLNKCRGRVNGGTWSSYINLRYNSSDYLSWFSVDGRGSDDNAYWDDARIDLQ